MSTTGSAPGPRVTQVSFNVDTAARDAEHLLDAWPTLPGVAAAAARAGVEVTVVQGAMREHRLGRDGVDYQFVGFAGADGRSRATIRELVTRVAASEPEVVHVQGLNRPAAVHELVRALTGVPVLVQDHGSSPPRRWRRALWRARYRDVAGVAFTAREQAEPWTAAGVLRRDVRVFEVMEGSSCFTPGSRDAARAATGLYGDPCLLWAGRLDANKDPLTTLEALERAIPELPDARLWCCFGDAPLLGAVRQRIARSSLLSERVTLLGRRPHAEMEALFRAADFLVQGSHHEACGFAVVEALACGTTPLVTDIPPLRRVVGAAGSLTPVGDAVALAAAMVEWSARDRETLRAGARRRFEDGLSYDTIGRQLRDAYEALAR